MSDESQPPPLRLKPRQPAAFETPPPSSASDSASPTPPPPASVEGDASRLRIKPLAAAASADPASDPPPAPPPPPALELAPPPASAGGTDSPPAASAEPSRPRLRPRLAVAEPATEPASAGSVETPQAPVPAPAVLAASALPPADAPVQAQEPAAEAASEAARFKLKPKIPASTPAPEIAPATETAPAEPTLQPEPPFVPPPSPELRPQLSSPPFPSVDAAEEIAALAANIRPEQKPAFKIGLLITAVLTLAVIGGGGYFGYRMFFAVPPTTASTPAKPLPVAQKVESAVERAGDKAREMASVPGQLIEKAQDALAGRRSHEQDRVDAAIEGREHTGERALRTRTPDEIAERLGRAEPPPPNRPPETVHLDLGSSTSRPSAPSPALDVAGPVAEATPEFKAFVTAARINGVFQGTPPRALINGRTVRPGDLLDSTLGVVFDRIDAARKLVFFKDRTGAVVAKKY